MYGGRPGVRVWHGGDDDRFEEGIRIGGFGEGTFVAVSRLPSSTAYPFLELILIIIVLSFARKPPFMTEKRDPRVKARPLEVYIAIHLENISDSDSDDSESSTDEGDDSESIMRMGLDLKMDVRSGLAELGWAWVAEKELELERVSYLEM